MPDEAWRAAQEIRQIAERLETALMARPGTMGMPSARGPAGPAASPIERLPPALRVALRGRYRRWCDEMAAILVSRQPRLSLLSLTLAVTVHGARLRDIEAWLGIRQGHGHVRRWLVCALTRYAWLTDGVDGGAASGLR